MPLLDCKQVDQRQHGAPIPTCAAFVMQFTPHAATDSKQSQMLDTRRSWTRAPWKINGWTRIATQACKSVQPVLSIGDTPLSPADIAESS